MRLDPQPLDGALERTAIDIAAHDFVSRRKVLGQSPSTASEIEDAQSGTADEPCDQPSPLVRAEDEVVSLRLMRPVEGV